MHYPHPQNDYEQGLQRIAGAIEMARRGAYRDGYLKMILEALEFLEKVSYQVGMNHRDGEMFARLKHEFKSQVDRQPEHAGVSPLAALVGEAEHVDVDINIDDVEKSNKNPLNRR